MTRVESMDRIRVRTIVITARQHAHKIGARSLTRAAAPPGSKRSTRVTGNSPAFFSRA